MNKTQVAILDDHHLFRTGICELVNKSGDFSILCSAGTPEELYKAFADGLPSVLLLDIRLKDANGLDVLRYVKANHEPIKVVMLTMHEESSYIQQMIEHGADGYLLKDITPEELFRSLHNVVKLGKYFGTEITARLINSLQTRDSVEKAGISFNELEIDILTLISEGLTAEEIAQKLYRSHRTIEGYKQRLLDKTESKNIAALISWCYKHGVLIPDKIA